MSGTPRFELHALGWKAFEDLCATVCRVVFGQLIERFLPSNDGGRDAAFLGSWSPREGEIIEGRFVMQCKHSSRRDQNLTLSDLEDDIAKASTLADEGLCDHYILLTNMGVSGRSAAAIEKRLCSIDGIETARLFGRDWLESAICEEPRLRMQVPRLYGLGDLTQILDERSYRQARAILETYRPEFATFVPTRAFHQSVNAIARHGFVLLLGAPAAGKSVIAASLALGSIDRWNCNPIKVSDPRDFHDHWNPDEPSQFFWIDDAFGSNQCEDDLIRSWNQQLPHLRAAVAAGARIVFTSRDYIFRLALPRLRTTAFPLLHESKVIIEVEQLNSAERERILYNHVRLGNQPKAVKTRLKPHLPGIAGLTSFLPESARRLGSQSFFRLDYFTEDQLRRFFDAPLDHLLEVVRGLDTDSRAALALLFMQGGSLAIPLDLTPANEDAIGRLGGTAAGVREALNAMQDSLTRINVLAGQRSWNFKHPTIRDAIAQYVATDPDLIDIYIHGADAKRIVREVVCGNAEVEGARVHVPASRKELLTAKLRSVSDQDRLALFVASRCDDEFAQYIVAQIPELLTGLERNRRFPLSANGHARLLSRLHKMNALPPEARSVLLSTIRETALEIPDPSFLRAEGLSEVLTNEEKESILKEIAQALEAEGDEYVERWSESYDDADEKYSALEDAKSCLRTFRESPQAAEVGITEAVGHVSWMIDDAMRDLESEQHEPDYDRDEFRHRPDPTPDEPRSIFDDVDQ